MSKKIYIDAGHGGKDPGAVSGKFIEKELNLKAAQAARDYLSAYDCEVVMSREKDTGTRVNDMAAKTKAIGASVSVSIHHNAGGGTGAEVFYWKGDEKAQKLAGLITNEFFLTGQKLRRTTGEEPGVKPSQPKSYNFGMCRINSNNGIPAILGEFAFVDSVADQRKIDADVKLKAEGEAYGKAVVNFLGLKKKYVPVPEPPKVGKKLTLSNTPLYISSTVKKATKNITGTYWLYDGILVNGRYRITNKETRVGRKPAVLNVTGWIDKRVVTLGK